MNIPMLQYPKLMIGLQDLPNSQKIATTRHLCRTDLYFLLRYALGREDFEHPWLFERCREIQQNPDGYLDLWAREHYKSTIITFGKTIQDILASHGEDPLIDQELTFGIFSHTRPIAKGFLRQIKREFEGNILLKSLFPDILWENPRKDAPKWSEDDGLVVKRKSNPKESTIEAWGLVDGQPTSKHFWRLIYDDVVTLSSVNTPEMIHKTTEAWEMSTNLGSDGGKERYIGTRYHFNDTYREIMARKAAEPRIYPATENGETDGNPVLLRREALVDKRRKQGPYTFACQMLQNPKADETQGFKESWLKYYQTHNDGEGLNIYILVDPANEKRKKSDYTSLWVIGVGGDRNYYCLEFFRDRLNLTERTNLLFRMHRKWNPKDVGYEKYGKDSDIAHIEDRMESENYRFSIRPMGGIMSKNDRIKRLIPLFEQGRIYLPYSMNKTNYEGINEDLVEIFLNEEYKAFPVSVHDDMLDALARIEDISIIWPTVEEEQETDYYQHSNWMN